MQFKFTTAKERRDIRAMQEGSYSRIKHFTLPAEAMPDPDFFRFWCRGEFFAMPSRPEVAVILFYSDGPASSVLIRFRVNGQTADWRINRGYGKGVWTKISGVPAEMGFLCENVKIPEGTYTFSLATGEYDPTTEVFTEDARERKQVYVRVGPEPATDPPPYSSWLSTTIAQRSEGDPIPFFKNSHIEKTHPFWPNYANGLMYVDGPQESVNIDGKTIRKGEVFYHTSLDFFWCISVPWESSGTIGPLTRGTYTFNFIKGYTKDGVFHDVDGGAKTVTIEVKAESRFSGWVTPKVVANIRLEGTPYSTTSKEDGYYLLGNEIPYGTYTLVAEHPDYPQYRRTVEVKGTWFRHDIDLREPEPPPPPPIPLLAIVVVGAFAGGLVLAYAK